MIEIEYDDREVRAALSRLAARTRAMRPVMAAIGGAVRSDIVERFDTSTAPDGQRWRPLTVAAIISRARRSSPSGFKKRRVETIRRFATGAKPLLDTGTLRNSIQIQRVTDTESVVGTKLPYAAIHQFSGRAGRGRKVTIPARPFIGVSAQGKDEIMAIIRRHLEAA